MFGPDVAPPNDGMLVTWHDAEIANNWDAVIRRDDVVYIHGDLSMSSTVTNQLATLEWVRNRPGRKRLLLGNHDPMHPEHEDSVKWHDHYYHAFQTVELHSRRKLRGPDGTVWRVMQSHFPYTGDRGEEDRYPCWRLPDCGRWLWHGHLHSSVPYHTPGTRQIDVGLDAWGLFPVREDVLIGMMTSIEAEL